MSIRFLVTSISLFFFFIPLLLPAQGTGTRPPREKEFLDVMPTVRPPYAGKYEARIGGSRESEGDKLRLDIGASVDIYRSRNISSPAVDSYVETSAISFGADFFTWTRLRASGGFKFPVEAVDYYFGINSAWHSNLRPVSDVRLRLAHISAHLVDGDPSFTSPEQQYITYSREFLDATIGFDALALLALRRPWDNPWRTPPIRSYIGAQWIFHTIPDTLGVLTPYAGFDGSLPLDEDLPLTLRFGYEARLNTELEPIGEHQLRLGLKLGEMNSRGVLVEGSYYSGRSHYGQHFHRRESFFALGFAVEF